MKAQFVYENMDFERGKDPKEILRIGISSKLSEVIPEIIDEIYMDHERDMEYIEHELEGSQLEELTNMLESGSIEDYYYPMKYYLSDAEKEELEDSFNLILQHPELSEPIANDYAKEEDMFSGIKIKGDHILAWWGPEDGKKFPF